MPDTSIPPPGTDLNLDVRLIEPGKEDRVAAILADATTEGTVEAARATLDTHRDTPGSAIFGVTLDHDLVAAYILTPAQMSVELVLVAVREDIRRRGIGRIVVQDALRRAGHRPMIVETDEAAMPFFTAIGFKKFGRRKGPNGEARYRLGWHTPGQRTPTGVASQHQEP